MGRFGCREKAVVGWRRFPVLACPGEAWSVRLLTREEGIILGMFLLAREEGTILVMFLLAREEGTILGYVLACPGGGDVGWCLLAREEREVGGTDSIASVLLAREESGPCVLACPGGELASRCLLAREEGLHFEAIQSTRH
jgi:hypothetical protein